MNPRTVCFCQPMVFMISERVAPFLRWSMATTWAVLLPSRTAPAAFFWPLGTLFVRLAFLPALLLAGVPLAAHAPPLALRSAFGLAGCSGCGCSGAPNPWMRAQMRLMAALLLLKLSKGVTPGRLFQIATRRSVGQLAANSASSFWLAKVSKGVVVAAAASSAEPNAVMLLSVSIVKVVIIVLLGATLCAVITWITPKCLKSKGNLQQITMAKNWRWRPTGSAGRLGDS